MNSYASLLRALLRAGLSDLGFINSGGYLVKDMGECVGGIYFQKCKYDADSFFVEAGVLSKRLDRFNRQFSSQDDTRPYAETRSQFSTRLTSQLADIPSDKWTLRRVSPLSDLVTRLFPLIASEAVRIFEILSTDVRMLTALMSNDKPCGNKLLRDLEWPKEPESFVYAAVLAHEVNPKIVDQLKEMAIASAGTALMREQVTEKLSLIGRPPLAPEDMLPEEAYQRLREISGQDFGNDYQAWKKWLRQNGSG